MEHFNSERRPVVLISVNREADREILKWILAGLEEQSVLWRLKVEEGEAAGLAYRAARESILKVGLGLSAAGQIALQQAQMGGHPLYLLASATPEEARALGENAGRLVKGLPLVDPGRAAGPAPGREEDLKELAARITRLVLDRYRKA
jgi:hypothetical protein